MTFAELMAGARAHPSFEGRELYKTKVGLKRATLNFLELMRVRAHPIPLQQLTTSISEIFLWSARCSLLLNTPSGTLEAHCLTCNPNRNVLRAMVLARELEDQVAKFVILSDESHEPNRARSLSIAVFAKAVRVVGSFGLTLSDLQVPEQASA